MSSLTINETDTQIRFDGQYPAPSNKVTVLSGAAFGAAVGAAAGLAFGPLGILAGAVAGAVVGTFAALAIIAFSTSSEKVSTELTRQSFPKHENPIEDSNKFSKDRLNELRENLIRKNPNLHELIDFHCRETGQSVINYY